MPPGRELVPLAQGSAAILERHLPHDDARLRLAPAAVIGLVVRNLVCSHRPLYGLGEWADKAFILEATAFPNAAHDDQVDGFSMYLIETYLVGGKATLSVPTGVIPLSAARRQRQQALPVQQRLTAGGQPSHWGQALSPFQQRLTDRQRRR